MKFKVTLIILVIIAILSSVISIYISLRKAPSGLSSQNQLPASVSGTFDINGVVPTGATITLTEKERNSTQKPTIFASNLPIIDQSPWSFNTAQVEKSYEIQAEVVVNGVVVETSSPLDVTAPADQEVLVLNIEAANQTSLTVISGNIAVDGYIPDGATISVEGRRLGTQKFTTVAEGLAGQPRQFMDYTKAISGVSYEVQGTLLDKNGKIIGTSNLLTVTAPALNEELTINSSAVAPTPTSVPTVQPVARNTATPVPAPTSAPVTISGNINFNGAAPLNSRIVIFEKQMNASNYQVAVDNISPTNGVTWQWNSPQNGTWYTLLAILKQRQSNGTDTDIAMSAPTTIAAPAASVIMTINSGFTLSAPGGPITVNCQTYNGGPNQNNWNVLITFQAVSGAGSYWYQVGSTNGGSDIVNSANTSNTVNAMFNNNTTYYARYAYATAAVAALGSNQYSGFSSTTPLQCSH